MDKQAVVESDEDANRDFLTKMKEKKVEVEGTAASVEFKGFMG